MTDSTEPREVVIEFEVDETDAERVYNAMEKLAHDLGEIGTLSMSQRGDIDDLMRDAARYRWLRDCRAYPFGGTDWDDLDSLIDAEIAREGGR